MALCLLRVQSLIHVWRSEDTLWKSVLSYQFSPSKNWVVTLKMTKNWVILVSQEAFLSLGVPMCTISMEMMSFPRASKAQVTSPVVGVGWVVFVPFEIRSH